MANTPDTLITQGYQARREHRLANAKQLFAEAVELCRKADDRKRLAKALTGIGQIERDLHDREAARKHYEEAVTLYRALDDPLRLAHTVRHVGDILQDDGQRELAEPCYEEALEIYREHQETSPLDLANTIAGFARLKVKTG
ncbi:MAG: tetratricopeptide repeat protein, partial [Acidobacteriota bacterium]|nr:tetratricopeptide repeat protein [Acidobacteriota bacterium]